MPSVYSGDLRGEAKDLQRDRNHVSKWSRGVVQRRAANCNHVATLTCDTCARLPRKVDNRGLSKVFGGTKAQAPHKNTIARKALQNVVVDALDEDTSDSSSWDDAVEASAAPGAKATYPGEADITYSFDAATGPGRGSQILSYAINQAVQRFENNETDKIVKEYDLVLDGKDELDFADAEDDFEVVDAAQLN